MSNKKIALFCMFFPVFMWDGICRAEDSIEDQGAVLIAPENEVPLCPLTVQVHPEIIHSGDPLFVQLRFHNTTDKIAYMPFCTMDKLFYGSLNMMGYITCGFEVDTENGNRTLYEWDGEAGAGMGHGNDPAWQIVRPGEEKTLAFVTKYTSAQLRQKRLPGSMSRSDRGMGEDTMGLEMGSDGCVGRFTVTLRNVSHWNTTLSKRKLHSLSTSRQIRILPRGSHELAQYQQFCGFLRKYAPGMGGNIGSAQLLYPNSHSQKPMPTELRKAYERILPILTLGPLKDLLTQDLYVIRFVAACQPMMDSTTSKKVLDEYEQWLKTTHEIERDALIHRMSPERLRQLITDSDVTRSVRELLESYEALYY